MKAHLTPLLLAATLALSGPLHASTTLYDTLGDSNVASGFLPNYGGSYSNTDGLALTMRFRATSDWTIDRILFPATFINTQFINLRLEIWDRDPESGLPYTLLESQDCFCETGNFGLGKINSVAFSGSTTLLANQFYWFSIRRLDDPSQRFGWTVNDQGARGTFAYQTSSGYWVPGSTAPVILGAYRLEGSVVPVPAAVWLFGSAMAALGLIRTNRHKD